MCRLAAVAKGKQREDFVHKLMAALVGATALALGSGADAAITLTGNVPGLNPYSGPTPTYTFDPGSQPLVTGGGFVSGTNGILYAQPFGTSGFYYAVGPSTSTTGTIDLSSFGDITDISFIWGSVDSYNTLEFLDSSMNVLQTFVGNDIFDPANGDRTDPNTNPFVTFMLTGSDIGNFAYLRLNSTSNSFEIDNLVVGPIPEPGTWALMLIGFAGIGLAMRRDRKRSLAQLA
jgi:hypothetical protein